MAEHDAHCRVNRRYSVRTPNAGERTKTAVEHLEYPENSCYRQVAWKARPDREAMYDQKQPSQSANTVDLSKNGPASGEVFGTLYLGKSASFGVI